MPRLERSDDPRHHDRPAPQGPVEAVGLRPGPDPVFAAPSEFHVDVLSTDGIHRVVLRGELDMLGAPSLWERVCEACAQPTREVRLDLRRLTFMDSSGLHVVLNTRELCARSGYRFQIVGGTPAVRRLFEVCGLASLIAPQRP